MSFQLGVVTSGYVERKNTEDGPVEAWIETFFVGAQDGRGHRWGLQEAYGSEAEAEVALAAVVAAGSDPATQPDIWFATMPCYGSEAWDQEADRELACFEADCYGEPRPNW
jgi:hypothetical protein